MSEEIKQNSTKNKLFSPGDLVLGHYKIIKEIGRGGMNSIVYLAEDVSIDKTQYFAIQNKYAAIKVINRNKSITDAEWTKFMDECVTTNRASNLPNIVKTFQVFKTDDNNTIIIAMEYIDGISLREYLNRVGNLSVNEAIFLFSKILNGVNELHNFRQKIIHRDLKPENILLSQDFRQVKIIDFGISSVVEIKEESINKQIYTNEDSLYGTYPYISPEIFKMVEKNVKNLNSNFISEQFDFYSLGVIFYEMLTGQKPFFADNYNDINVIKLPLTYDIPPMNDINPNISPQIENIIFKCLASKKEDLKFRYQSIKEIIRDIKEYENDSLHGTTVKLLKPKNERTFQIKNAFEVQKQKNREKFYEKWWFFWTIISVSVIILIITILLKYGHMWGI